MAAGEFRKMLNDEREYGDLVTVGEIATVLRRAFYLLENTREEETAVGNTEAFHLADILDNIVEHTEY